MKFDEFWKKLKEMLMTKTDFETLTYRRPFRAKFYGEKVWVLPQKSRTGKELIITKSQFSTAWKIESKKSLNERFSTKDHHDTWRASYIVALFKIIVDDQEMIYDRA